MHGSMWRREETRPVGNAVRPRRLPPTLQRFECSVGRLLRHESDSAGPLADRRESDDRQAPRGCTAGAGVVPAFMPTQNSAPVATTAGRSNYAPRPEIGEWEVRGDVRAGTRFHFRTGFTSVVPWLVGSDTGGQVRRLCASVRGGFAS